MRQNKKTKKTRYNKKYIIKKNHYSNPKKTKIR